MIMTLEAFTARNQARIDASNLLGWNGQPLVWCF